LVNKAWLNCSKLILDLSTTDLELKLSDLGDLRLKSSSFVNLMLKLSDLGVLIA